MYIRLVENTQNDNGPNRRLIVSYVSIYIIIHTYRTIESTRERERERERERAGMEGVRTSRLFFCMLVLRFTNEHMSILRARLAIFGSFAFFFCETYCDYVLERKFTTLDEHETFFCDVLGVTPSQMNSIDT